MVCNYVFVNNKCHPSHIPYRLCEEPMRRHGGSRKCFFGTDGSRLFPCEFVLYIILLIHVMRLRGFV